MTFTSPASVLSEPAQSLCWGRENMGKRAIVSYEKRLWILLMKLPPPIFKFFLLTFFFRGFLECAFLEVETKRMMPAHSVRLMRRLDRKERSKRKKESWKDRKEKGGLQDKNELRWSRSMAPQTDDDQPKRTERDNGLFSKKRLLGSYLSVPLLSNSGFCSTRTYKACQCYSTSTS
jgi:hypothetical protein